MYRGGLGGQGSRGGLGAKDAFLSVPTGAKRIPFGNTAGDALIDSADFTWDDVLKSLELSGADPDLIIDATTGNGQLDFQKAGVSVAKLRTGTTSLNLESASLGLVFNSSGASGTHIFSTNGVDRMVIGSAGDVAVGPSIDTNYRLKVFKGAVACALFVHGSASGSMGSVRVGGAETEAALVEGYANDAAGTLMGVAKASRAFHYSGSAVTGCAWGTLKADGVLFLCPGNALTGTITKSGADGMIWTLGTTVGATWGGTAAEKQAWWGAAPAAQQVLATGAGKVVDDVIAFLQSLGFCRQA